jgi:hypothetical protein
VIDRPGEAGGSAHRGADAELPDAFVVDLLAELRARWPEVPSVEADEAAVALAVGAVGEIAAGDPAGAASSGSGRTAAFLAAVPMEARWEETATRLRQRLSGTNGAVVRTRRGWLAIAAAPAAALVCAVPLRHGGLETVVATAPEAVVHAARATVDATGLDLAAVTPSGGGGDRLAAALLGRLAGGADVLYESEAAVRRDLADRLHEGPLQDLTAAQLFVDSLAAHGNDEEQTARGRAALRRAVESARALMAELTGTFLPATDVAARLRALADGYGVAAAEVALPRDFADRAPDAAYALHATASEILAALDARGGRATRLTVVADAGGVELVLDVVEPPAGASSAAAAAGVLDRRAAGRIRWRAERLGGGFVEEDGTVRLRLPPASAP